MFLCQLKIQPLVANTGGFSFVKFQKGSVQLRIIKILLSGVARYTLLCVVFEKS